jgi:hypothetical protein
MFEKYVEQFNLFGENINTRNKITDAAVLTAGKQFCLEVNKDIIKSMFIAHQQNAAQNHNTAIHSQS